MSRKRLDHRSMRYLQLLSMALALTCVCHETTLAQAQFQLGRGRSTTTRPQANIFLPAPRELRLELIKAGKELKQERYVDAITRLDAILSGRDATGDADAELAEDYFLTPGPDGTEQSLKSEALKMLADLPPGGQASYELQFGTDARQLLTAAVDQGDPEILVEIVRRFGYTQAGQEATLLLGRDRLERGRMIAATMLFQRLANHPSAAKRFGGELQILLASSLMLSNRSDEAKLQLAGQPNMLFEQSGIAPNDDQPPPRVEIPNIAGRQVEYAAAGTDPLEWLTQYTGTLAPADSVLLEEWLLFGGNEQRDGVSDVGMPLMTMRWDLDFALRYDEEAHLQREAKMLANMAPTPALHPLVTDKWVLMRSADQLWGVDPQKQGKRIWEFPWARDTEANSATTVNSYAAGGVRRPTLLKNRVWEDALYGQLSSDGDAVYLLNKLKGVYNTNRSALGMPVTNELVALDLNRQGAALWIVGGEQLDDEPKLAGMFFLGAPLPIGDELYCVGELNNELRLLCLDKQQGTLLWSQQLAHVDMRRSYSVDGQRRMKGVNLAHADGILVCPTSAGGVVAIDVSSRAFLWGFRYKSTNAFKQPTSSRPGIARWRDNAATIANGRVVLSPLDSNELFCLDLLTGKKVWKSTKQRGNNLYVAGVHDNRIIIVGMKSVSAISLKDGSPVWSQSLMGKPAGRGVQGTSHYLLATASPDELLKIDLASGDIAERVPTDEPLGNLVAYQDQLYSQNHKRLRAFYQKGKLQQRVGKLLATNPQDPWALEHQAMLLLDKGQRLEGVRALRQAIAAYPDDGSDSDLAAKQLLVATSLAMLRDNEPGATALVQEIEPLIAGPNPEFPDQQVDFLRLVTVNLVRAGETEKAFQRNLELMQRKQLQTERSSLLVSMANDFVSVGKHRKLSQDRWHRAIFRDAWMMSTPAQQARIAQLAKDALEKSPTKNSPIDRATLIEAMQDLPVLQPQQLAAIREQLVQGETAPLAEGRLLSLRASDDPAIAGKATALLAQLYIANDLHSAAAEAIATLRVEYGDVEVYDQLTGEAFADDAVAGHQAMQAALAARAAKAASANGAFPLGQVVVTKAPPQPQAPMPDMLNRIQGVDLEAPFGNAPFGLDLLFDQATKRLIGRDAMGNPRPLASLNVVLSTLRGRDMRIRTNGHYCVATAGGSVVAINGLVGGKSGEQSVLWQESAAATPGYPRTQTSRDTPIGLGLTRKIPSPSTGSTIALGPVNEHGVVFRRYGELLCLHPLTGEPIWKRDDVALNSEIWGNDEWIFAHVPGRPPAGDSNARVFSAIDGRELESRPVADQRERIRMFGQHVLSLKVDLAGDVPQDTEKVLRKILSKKNDFGRWTSRISPDGLEFLRYRIQLNDLMDREKTFAWSKSVGFDSLADFVNDHELAIYDANAKRFMVISIDDGREIINQPLDVELKKVDSIDVQLRCGLYVIKLGQNVTRSVARPARKSVVPNMKLQNMEIHAFTKDNRIGWDVPAKISEFVAMPYFGADLPLLCFLRKLEPIQKKKRQVEVLALDVRDGRAVLQETGFLASGQLPFQVRGIPERNQINIRIPADEGSWRLQLSDTPKTPGAPFGQPLPPKPEPVAEAEAEATDDAEDEPDDDADAKAEQKTDQVADAADDTAEKTAQIKQESKEDATDDGTEDVQAAEQADAPAADSENEIGPE